LEAERSFGNGNLTLPMITPAFYPPVPYSTFYLNPAKLHMKLIGFHVPQDLRMRSLKGNTVMSHNTPVTLLTNFWLVLGHTVTSICIPRFPKLCFALELGYNPVTYPPSHHLHCLQIMEALHHQPISCYILRLTLVPVRLCFLCPPFL